MDDEIIINFLKSNDGSDPNKIKEYISKMDNSMKYIDSSTFNNKLNRLSCEKRIIRQTIRKNMAENAKYVYGYYREGVEVTHYQNCRFKNLIIYKELCDKCCFSKGKCEFYKVKFMKNVI